MMSFVRFILLLAICFCGVAVAADPVPPPSCSSKEHRQFDFWIGEWEVFNPEGQKVGENTITQVLDGCALHENWHSEGAFRGNSYNIYDASRGVWHQSWVDNTGTLLRLEGGFKDGAMELTGETQSDKGKLLNRIRWTQEEEHVRQVWQVSQDGGEQWKTIFDGLYKQKQQKPQSE
ncbi:hypothetical protein [Kangiella koreensis]|uniref:TPR repeat-containing protein n=1 Tax=Kangiella koreensis (strain DSM 16069 / JCM 12317 / KCTC 12182 / SW-125) TaxID=523791 RepID=C7R919_KANKD|nr:hypothetical protein [Kangiella koreensis]ACV27809.1 TPR repeat-containing protein [Kangiella koreensis DSM 16069]